MVEGEEDPFRPHLPLLPEVPPPPEEGMDPEHGEDGDQKGGHEDEGPVKDRIPLWIVMGGMGDPKGEVFGGPWVAFSTGLHQPFFGDEGFGIFGGQDAVESMAIGAPGHEGRIT